MRREPLKRFLFFVAVSGLAIAQGGASSSWAVTQSHLAPGDLAPAPAPELELSLPSGLPDDVNWDEIFRPRNHHGVRFGVSIRGPSPYTRDAGAEFTPASTTKLFTAGAALERLHGDYTYSTRMSWVQVDERSPERATALKIMGSGDPSWGLVELGESLTSRIDAFTQELKNAGVREIDGEIGLVSSDPRWDALAYPEGWGSDDKISCYGALAQSFNLDVNCASLVVSGPKSASWREPGVPTPIRMELQPGSETQIFVEPVNSPGVVAAGFRLRGTWRSGDNPRELVLPIHNVRGWIRNLFVLSLKKRGIRYAAGAVVQGRGPARQKTYLSPPLREIFKPFLKNSINVIGDAIFKKLGEEFGPRSLDLIAAGREVLADYSRQLGSATATSLGLRPISGFFSDHALFFDGAGISSRNKLTTGALMALLTDLRLRPDFSLLWDALPIAGKDGTLRGRMRGTAAEGVLRAKTGTLRGAYNLAGYVPHLGLGGAPLDFIPFVILTNTSEKNAALARSAEDRAGALLSRLVNPESSGLASAAR